MLNVLLKFCLLFISSSTQYNLIEEISLDKIDLLVLDEQIESKMAYELIYNIFERDEDFYLYIDSNGGDVESGLKIVKMMNYLQQDNIKITCIAKKAMSMAFHIFQNCDDRLVLEDAILMQHEMTIFFKGGLEESKKEIDKFIIWNNKMNVYESMRLKMDLNLFISELKKEIWFTGNDILTHNAADRKVVLI